MARTATVPLPAAWRTFVRNYASDLSYWYQPKGLAVTVETVRERLEVLREFEGTGRPWRECQADYITRLNEEGISTADGPALARMLKQVMAVLGLAWVDPQDRVEITAAGDTFLASPDPAAVLATQSLRYQLWNPVISSKVLQSIRLHPVPFLVRLLQAVDGEVTMEEYTLFVARARRITDADRVAGQIDLFRQLAPEQQRRVVSACDAYGIGGPKRGSLYNTIRLDRSYAANMWTLSGLIERGGKGLRLRRGVLRGKVREYLDDYNANGTYIKFATEKNFLAWMGDPELRATNAAALDVYTTQGDLASAAEIKRRMGASTKEVSQFRRMMISEKTLEDNIEADFAEFGKRIGRNLELVGRQYETTVGPIDLLARERPSGRYVVIELKKGRSADKVFGQLSRYMGWVKKNLADGKDVAGVIVGSRIDDKLRAARDAHDTQVDLVEYESRVSISKV